MNDWVEKVTNGDVRTVARLIRDVDDGMPEVRDVLKALYPHTGKAYIIGITGAPGVGKSTLVDQMVAHLRKRGKTVGVLAVDPTSPFSGGRFWGTGSACSGTASTRGSTSDPLPPVDISAG